MKKAVIRVVVVHLDCPDCGEGIPAPDNGSFLWPCVDTEHRRVVSCPACHVKLVVPKLEREFQ